MKKTLFITGASSGIGKATVELFAERGWNVAATVRNLAAHHDLFAQYSNVRLYELDVTNFEQVAEVASAVIAQFPTIDIVVNNAGYCLMGPTETSTLEQIKEQYETNVFGVFAVIKAFIPHFRAKQNGMFINIASSSAQFNYPYIAAYGSSKWAVRGLTESLGIELAPFNISVKAIYPGTHATKIFTKLDDGTGEARVFQEYQANYENFTSAQASIPEVTSPTNIANEIWKAAQTHNGQLHIISGGDAKLFAFLKKMLPERIFQNVQIRSIMQPVSSSEAAFARWLMGSNTDKLNVLQPRKRTH